MQVIIKRKFNIGGSENGHPVPAGIGGILRVAVKEALMLFVSSRSASVLNIASDSVNVVKWIKTGFCILVDA